MTGTSKDNLLGIHVTSVNTREPRKYRSNITKELSMKEWDISAKGKNNNYSHTLWPNMICTMYNHILGWHVIFPGTWNVRLECAEALFRTCDLSIWWSMHVHHSSDLFSFNTYTIFIFYLQFGFMGTLLHLLKEEKIKI